MNAIIAALDKKVLVESDAALRIGIKLPESQFQNLGQTLFVFAKPLRQFIWKLHGDR